MGNGSNEDERSQQCYHPERVGDTASSEQVWWIILIGCNSESNHHQQPPNSSESHQRNGKLQNENH